MVYRMIFAIACLLAGAAPARAETAAGDADKLAALNPLAAESSESSTTSETTESEIAEPADSTALSSDRMILQQGDRFGAQWQQLRAIYGLEGCWSSVARLHDPVPTFDDFQHVPAGPARLGALEQALHENAITFFRSCVDVRELCPEFDGINFRSSSECVFYNQECGLLTGKITCL